MKLDASGRLIYKILANALWGRLALNSAKYKTIGMIKDVRQLIAIIKGEGEHELVDIINSLKSDVILYSYTEKTPKKSKDTNLLVPSYVTCLARLELYSAIETLGNSVLYCDTDSVIYYTSDKIESDTNTTGHVLDNTGHMIGQWDDEIVGTFGKGCKILEFVAAAPKTYGLKILTADNCIVFLVKMKGITLDPNEGQRDFEKIKKIVFKKNYEIPIPSKQFRVLSNGGGVQLKSFVKQLRDTSEKRHIMNNRLDTLPWGYSI